MVEVFRSFPLHREAVRVQLRSCADIQRALQKVCTCSDSVVVGGVVGGCGLTTVGGYDVVQCGRSQIYANHSLYCQ